MADCKDCGLPFAQEFDWQRQCPICFKEAKGYAMTASDASLARLQTHTRELQQELQKLRAAGSKPNPAPAAGPIPTDMFRRLLMLCHPDKHQNSELANEVTKWLLNQRKT